MVQRGVSEATEHLDLSHNRLGAKGCEALTSLLSSPSASLVSLRLVGVAGGHGLPLRSVVGLLDAVADNTSLQARRGHSSLRHRP